MILDLPHKAYCKSAANLSFAKGGKPENSERGCTYGNRVLRVCANRASDSTGRVSIADFFEMYFQGNLQFADDNREQATVVHGDTELPNLAFLLGTEAKDVKKALCFRVVAAGGSVVEKAHHAKDASYGREALAKVLAFYRPGRKP